jgi:hypothetical protein
MSMSKRLEKLLFAAEFATMDTNKFGAAGLTRPRTTTQEEALLSRPHSSTAVAS